MQNHYRTLGVNTSATPEEIRRAYRILARRYHPDVNPDKGSAEKFRAIALAYEVLVDDEKRRQYEIDFEYQERRKARERMGAYAQEAEQKNEEIKRASTSVKEKGAPRPESKSTDATSKKPPTKTRKQEFNLFNSIKKSLSKISGAGRSAATSGGARSVSRISIVEVSLTVKDAITGIKKAVEINEPGGTRKVSVRIPPGVRNGSVVRLKNTSDAGEELVLVVRVASHPFLSIQTRGLVMEVPITINEALSGASITVPTLEEPVVVKVPAGAQSGTELRLKGKGIHGREGVETDLVVRFMIRVPESADAVGLKDKAVELDTYYEHNVRQGVPANIMEFFK